MGIIGLLRYFGKTQGDKISTMKFHLLSAILSWFLTLHPDITCSVGGETVSRPRKIDQLCRYQHLGQNSAYSVNAFFQFVIVIAIFAFASVTSLKKAAFRFLLSVEIPVSSIWLS